ncbi:MAG: hypothetical protein CVU89_08585 [Firmicutes bacterium HGW-Firmicutes-14]|jgi:hypothetical protein|nr:MAG: hypothetical protein CVU89_08585 [Firmicutes bacterium HGW-Firmicutes-14]
MMQRFFHFTITCDARRQIPKMILERLVDEYIWQGEEYRRGTASVKERAKRVRELVEAEIKRRNAGKEFERLMARRLAEEEEEKKQQIG